MRSAFLISLLFAAAPLGAQETAGDLGLPEAGVRPAEVVARMAREAMGISADPDSWRALADALPELALVGGADLEATFEAARIADSLSASVETGVAYGAEAEPTGGEALTAGSPNLTALVLGVVLDRWADLALAALILSALGLGLVTLRARRSPEDLVPTGSRVMAARTLASSGLPPHEIARRTGMAQDAVKVLLGLSGQTAAAMKPAPSKAAVTRRTRTVAPAVPDPVDLEREARLAARRLRDQRLTYGPGVRA